MSSVSDYVTCKQCGFEEAYYDFNCNTNEWDVSCGRCGYYAAAKRHEDNDGKVTWTYPEEQGVGVLFYHCVDSLPYVHQPLSSKESVEDAEKWLRERIAAGKVEANSGYLTRWNEEKKVVEFVIGSNESSFPSVDLNSFDDDPPAPAKPAKPTIPIWIHSQKLQNYANSFKLPKYRREFLDMVQRKIDTHDQAWFSLKHVFVSLTEPEDPSEWKRFEL